ncbi:helix-turn-helix transcriptional regulator [Actinophytocola oryzae]|uniref:Regulatory LuxR family protein n=1 Tax=Actinophytocola oryzae TaxID=502181 RepID=A0A4R7V1L9_9PSEU|nr:LuxR family transcriptional regulator [Actinophytocola oryzae]TDV43193.1 regulatory LuxR family protein [Actinophytocola oryzae]
MNAQNRSPGEGRLRSDGSAGRAGELARLASVVDAATTSVQVVQVSGDPWIGKTRLLTDLAEMARHRGWTVLEGSADAGSCSPPGGIPYGVLADAFDGLMATGPDLTGVPDEHRQCLAGIFPSLADLWPQNGTAPDGDATDAIHALLCALASPEGLLLVVDDLQFVDGGSLDLLSRLVRQPPAGRFVLALAYRRRQVDMRVLSALAQLREGYPHVEIELTPLADEDAAALLPPDLSDLRRQSLLRQGGGNPGVVRAIGSVSMLPGSPEDSLHHLPHETLTACFRDFRTLSRLGWLAARAAAVHAEPADADLIKAIAELTETEIWHALDEVTAVDVLRIDEGSHTFRFRDPLLRTAAYRSASTGWRIGAHRRAAAWLRSRSAPPVEVAHHLLGSDDIRDAPSVEAVLDAAESVLWDRPTRAASWVRATIGSVSLDSGTVARQHLLLGKSLTLAGPVQAAATTLDLVDERHLDDAKHRADLACWRGAAARLLGRHDHAAALLRHALRSMPAEDTYARLLLHVELTAIALERNAELDQADLAAVREAARAGGTDTALHAYLVALLSVADAGQARTTVDVRAVGRLADELTTTEVIRLPHTLLWVARVEVTHGLLDEARAHLQHGLEIARDRLLTGLVPPIALELAALAARRGDTAAASAHANDAVQAALLIESSFLLDVARNLQVQLATGGLPEAEDQPSVPESRSPADSEAAAEPQLDRLSERELEIAVLVSKGRTNQQIARALTLSHKTVETYLARIFKKLCVCSRTQVATLIGQRAIPAGRLRSAHAGHGVQ